MLLLQFSTSNGIVPAIIKFYTWSAFSHVDVVLKNGLLLGSAKSLGGVRVHNRKYRKSELYYINTPLADSIVSTMLSQVGKPYDMGAIRGTLLRKNWQREDEWTCSELIIWACREHGVNLLNGNKHEISPRDLLMSPYVHKYTPQVGLL